MRALAIVCGVFMFFTMMLNAQITKYRNNNYPFIASHKCHQGFCHCIPCQISRSTEFLGLCRG